MKIVIQRVSQASVTIDGKIAGAIQQGLLLLVGICPEDGQEDIDYAVRKISQMRIFSDDADKMNLSVQDVGGQILSISQFTLYADTKRAIGQPLQGLPSLIWLPVSTTNSTRNWPK